jgi:hypothetical protein
MNPRRSAAKETGGRCPDDQFQIGNAIDTPLPTAHGTIAEVGLSAEGEPIHLITLTGSRTPIMSTMRRTSRGNGIPLRISSARVPGSHQHKAPQTYSRPERWVV